MTQPLNQTQQDAFSLLSSTLKAWGLDTLVPDLRNFIIAGDTNADTLSLKLSQTDAYKQRFAGNELRKAQGLPELSPAQYIGVEEAYSNVMRSYGLPPGYFDSPQDFTKLIGDDVSPAELDTRAKIAHDQYLAAPDAVKNLWSTYFGGKGDALALIMDPDVATSVIQDRATQVGIGGAAALQGLTVGQGRAQQLQQAGVTLAGAQRAYSQIAQSLPTDTAIANRFGTTFDQKDEENDLLLGNGDAANKRQNLYSEEQALFRSRTATDGSALGVSQSY